MGKVALNSGHLGFHAPVSSHRRYKGEKGMAGTAGTLDNTSSLPDAMHHEGGLYGRKRQACDGLEIQVNKITIAGQGE